MTAQIPVARFVAHIVAGLLTTASLAEGQATAPPPFTSFIQDLRDREYSPIRDNVLRSLALLDERALAFRPAPPIRELRAELEHLAAVNLRLCGMAIMRMGDTPAPAPAARDTTVARTLAEVVAYVRGSFDSCDRALSRIDDTNAKERTIGPYMRYSHLQAMVTHAGHEYGKMTVYLRLLGLTPPSSAGR
jgi:uncharacterized damage-inducible protein DinB